MRDFYPVTIVRDPNAGVYSGGMFIAWNREADDIWWAENTEPVGIADTPDGALADLVAKLTSEPDSCPFCGEAAEMIWDNEAAEIACTDSDCGAIIKGRTRAEVLRRWNRRATPSGVWEV